jgi:hypothetical protein
MMRLALVFGCFALVTGAVAQERIVTRSMSCAALQGRVARDRTAILASSETAYETVHVDPGACGPDETGAPAFEPTADLRACLAGWRCKQRNSDSGPR